GVRSDLTAHVLDDPGRVLLREPRDDILEEADDGMTGHIPGLDEALWLDDGLRRVVEFEDRVVARCVVIRHRARLLRIHCAITSAPSSVPRCPMAPVSAPPIRPGLPIQRGRWWLRPGGERDASRTAPSSGQADVAPSPAARSRKPAAARR